MPGRSHQLWLKQSVLDKAGHFHPLREIEALIPGGKKKV